MQYQLFPDTQPLTVPSGGSGPLLPFFVPIGAEETYLRVVALWRDNTPLVGEAPSFQLKSGRDGRITTVDADGATASVFGGKEDTVARATCQRLPGDTYLIRVSDMVEDAGPWYLRIRNNDPETLRFAWVSSGQEPNTFQPWMALEVPRKTDDDEVLSLVGDERDVELVAHNWGTAPLILNDQPGAKLGGNSAAVLMSRPAQIAPHDSGRINLRCGPVSFVDTYEHVFDTNDAIAAHNTLRFQTVPAFGGPGFVPSGPAPFCRRCGRCLEYLPPQAPPTGAGGPCRRAGCGHPAAAHFELSPDRRNR